MKYGAATVNGVISASAEALYKIVSDINRHKEMAGSGEIQAVEWVTPPPVKVGSQFKSRQKIGMEYGTKSFIVVCETNRKFVWFSGATGKPPFGQYWGFEFEPMGKNRTRVYHGTCVPIALPNIPPFTWIADAGARHEVGNMEPTYQKLAKMAGGKLEGTLAVMMEPLCSLKSILKLGDAPCGSVVA